MPSTLDHALIDKTAAEIDEELVRLRREIHQHPELAGGEVRTAALVAERLRAAGLAVTTGVGGHGVLAVLDGAGEGPTVAYRADMDAVDDDELFECEFASQVPGVAHLCGHDVHTTAGVGIALVLARLRERLNGRLVFVFQPAEESFEGADAMIQDGALERTPPQEIYALHCGPAEVGTFAVLPGQPGLDRFQIELSGPSAAEDASRLVAMIDGLSTVQKPRTPEAFEQLVADLETPDGPLARFVYAQVWMSPGGEGATVHCGLRAWPDDRYPELRDELRGWVAALPGARVEYAGEPYPAMVSSPELNAVAATYLRDALGAEAVTVGYAAYPFNGEDFAYFLHRVPGAMFYLGVANAAAGIDGVPHSPYFAVDERAIGVGVRAMAGFLSSRLAALA